MNRAPPAQHALFFCLHLITASPLSRLAARSSRCSTLGPADQRLNSRHPAALHGVPRLSPVTHLTTLARQLKALACPGASARDTPHRTARDPLARSMLLTRTICPSVPRVRAPVALFCAAPRFAPAKQRHSPSSTELPTRYGAVRLDGSSPPALIAVTVRLHTHVSRVCCPLSMTLARSAHASIQSCGLPHRAHASLVPACHGFA